MIEEIVIQYLSENSAIPSYMEEPKDKPVERWVITKTNHRITNHIQSATIMIWSYSDSLYGAAKLDETLRGLMDNITSLDSISRCALENSYNDTDTTKKQYRYRSEFDVVFFC